MKKVFKFLGTAAAVGAAVVGGIAVYKRFFAPAEDIADLDDEFDDEFDDEDLDSEPVPLREVMFLFIPALNRKLQKLPLLIRQKKKMSLKQTHRKKLPGLRRMLKQQTPPKRRLPRRKNKDAQERVRGSQFRPLTLIFFP